MGSFYKEFLIESPNPLYQQLGRQMVDYTDQATYDKMLREDVLVSNTHVMLGALFKYESEYGDFHWSKDVLRGADPNIVGVVNLVWEFREAYNHHLMLYHQVGII